MGKGRGKKTAGNAVEWIKTGIVLVILAAELAFGAHLLAEEQREKENVWIGSYPMANQNVEWTGAGYSFPWMTGGAEE